MKTTKYNEKLKPLFELIKKGDYNAVKKWIEDGKPILNPETSAYSALYYASSRCMFSILEVLLTLDWRKYTKHLDKALQQAVDKKHTDNARLLLEYGASPECVSWYNILDTSSRQIISMFLEQNKSLENLDAAFCCLSRGIARTFKEALSKKPELQNILIRAMMFNLNEIYGENGVIQPRTYEEVKEEKEYARYITRISLIRWIGCDIYKEIEYEKRIISVLGYAIINNDVRTLKTLKLSAEDSELINKHAHDISFFNTEKMELLVKCGLIINDLPDGTSSLLLEYVKCARFETVLFLINNGAKLTPVEDADLKYLRQKLFRDGFPDGIFLALAKVLPVDQIRYLLKHSKTNDILGDKPETIIRNLYDTSNSELPDTFDTLLNEVQEKLKSIKLHPIAVRYRRYCNKSDKKKLPYPFLQDIQEYCFNSLHASKKIRPWIILLLNDLIPELEKRGVKFTFEEQQTRAWSKIIDVDFYALIRTHKIPIEFHEKETSPKRYLSREKSGDSHIGKLQFCHRFDGCKNILATEKTFLQFQEKIEYLADRLMSVADKEDKREEERRLRHEKYELERLEEQRERERKEKLEEHRTINKLKVKEMIQEEEGFFKDISKKAKAFEKCRLMRHYIEALKNEWESENELNDEQKEWLIFAELLINRHDPFYTNTPKTIQDIEFPESIWDQPWSEIMDFIRSSSANCGMIPELTEK